MKKASYSPIFYNDSIYYYPCIRECDRHGLVKKTVLRGSPHINKITAMKYAQIEINNARA